jgi:hypothetical protein
MAELVQQEVVGPVGVGGEGAEEAVDPTASVAIVVDHDDQGVVGDVGGDIPHRAVVLGQHVTLGTKRIESRAERGRTEDAAGGLVAPALRGWDHNATNTDFAAAGFERSMAEQGLCRTVQISFENLDFPTSVALAEDCDIENSVRRTADVAFDHQRICGRRLGRDFDRGRVDDGVQKLDRGAIASVGRQGHSEGLLRKGKKHGFVIGPHRTGGCGRGCAILAEVAVETLGVKKGAAFWIVRMDTIPAVGKTVDQSCQRPGPRPLTVESIDRDDLLFGVAGMVIVDPQGGVFEAVFEGIVRRGSSGNGKDENQRDDCVAKHSGLPRDPC